jgi:hypothetical protein
MRASHILIGVLAGLVSVVLLATIVTGASLAFVLVLLSPLPLVIVGLGWSWRAAIAGALVASLGLALLTVPSLGLVYLLGVGGPAAGLAYVALLGRPAEESGSTPPGQPGGMEWYPIGRIVAWIALVAAALGAVFVLQFGWTIADYLAATRASTEASLRVVERLGQVRAPMAGAERDQLVRFIALVVPAVVAGTAFLAFVLNLWLGGRIVVRSGRSPRPWPDVANELVLPQRLLVTFAVALGASFILTEVPGMIAGLLAATLTLAYAVQGLAVLHAVTRGAPVRFLMLGGVYAALIVASGPALIPLALLGLLDPFLALRARAAARANANRHDRSGQ